MSAINSLSATSNVQQISHIKSGAMRAMAKPENDSRQGKDGGGLLGAIDSALKSAGITGGLSSIFGNQDSTDTATDSTSSTSSTDASSSTQASAQTNFDAFMQNLIAALQSSTTSSDSSSSSIPNSETEMRPPPPMGMGGDMQSKLEELLTKLTNSSTADNSTADSSTSDNDSTNSNLTTSFQALISSLGGTTSNSDLSTFLKTLSDNLAGQGVAGGFISATA
jgi:hypothetical protein